MDAGRLLYFFNERRYLGDANQEDQILVLIVLPRASEHVLGKAAKRLCWCKHDEVTLLYIKVQVQAFQLPCFTAAVDPQGGITADPFSNRVTMLDFRVQFQFDLFRRVASATGQCQHVLCVLHRLADQFIALPNHGDMTAFKGLTERKFISSPQAHWHAL